MNAKTSKREADSSLAARHARLQYWADQTDGIKRVARGRAFRYVASSGRPIKDVRTLQRIRKLAIPPAWSDVRICPRPDGHLQATGHDARGRKQYRYHERWTAIRDESKFDRIIEFATALPRIRRRIQNDLERAELPRDKVLATVVCLLEATLIRVGNDEYARDNHSFGLTTLRDKHAHIGKKQIQFEFRGKSGVQHQVAVHDRRLARIVKRCQDIPGQHLFQYVDDEGRRHPIGSADVNEYLRSAGDGEFTAKDFRTWGATLLAARAFYDLPTGDSNANTKHNVTQAIEAVARQLGNTAAVCKKCYIHSAIIDKYLDGSLLKALKLPMRHKTHTSSARLSVEEKAVLNWLRKILNSPS